MIIVQLHCSSEARISYTNKQTHLQFSDTDLQDISACAIMPAYAILDNYDYAFLKLNIQQHRARVISSLFLRVSRFKLGSDSFLSHPGQM